MLIHLPCHVRVHNFARISQLAAISLSKKGSWLISLKPWILRSFCIRWNRLRIVWLLYVTCFLKKIFFCTFLVFIRHLALAAICDTSAKLCTLLHGKLAVICGQNWMCKMCKKVQKRVDYWIYQLLGPIAPRTFRSSFQKASILNKTVNYILT